MTVLCPSYDNRSSCDHMKGMSMPCWDGGPVGRKAWCEQTERYHSWWRHQMETFPRYWPFVRGIHRSPVNSPIKGQWCGALMFSLICAWINHYINNRDAGDLRRYRAHYDIIVMIHTSVTADRPTSLWWLYMSWCQICTRTSATIMLTWFWLQSQWYDATCISFCRY